ncbi:hypothetical protein GCM10027262_74890 [Nocardia tengchongensis]
MPEDESTPVRKPELVSVIIPVFNGLPLLSTQLEGLAAQEYPDPFEVILSDNGSTDGLIEYLRDHPLSELLRLRRIDSSDRPGAPHARNVGAEAAEGDFLAFTDQDDWVHPGWLSALVEAAAEFDAVGGPIETIRLNTPKVARWRPSPPPEERFDSHYRFWAHGNNIAMWRTCFDKRIPGPARRGARGPALRRRVGARPHGRHRRGSGRPGPARPERASAWHTAFSCCPAPRTA